MHSSLFSALPDPVRTSNDPEDSVSYAPYAVRRELQHMKEEMQRMSRKLDELKSLVVGLVVCVRDSDIQKQASPPGLGGVRTGGTDTGCASRLRAGHCSHQQQQQQQQEVPPARAPPPPPPPPMLPYQQQQPHQQHQHQLQHEQKPYEQTQEGQIQHQLQHEKLGSNRPPELCDTGGGASTCDGNAMPPRVQQVTY